MAGVFVQRVKVYNRAPIPLAVFFDGERMVIPPGEFELPAVTTYMMKNQNPRMGTGDPDNPHEDGTKYLIVLVGEEGFGEPLTKEEWESHLGKPCRVDEQAAFAEKYANDPKAKLIVRGVGKKSTAANKYEAGGALKSSADFTHRDA
jgi:hypothetical protein